jgi:hypothetical protein
VWEHISHAFCQWVCFLADGEMDAYLNAK